MTSMEKWQQDFICLASALLTPFLVIGLVICLVICLVTVQHLRQSPATDRCQSVKQALIQLLILPCSVFLRFLLFFFVHQRSSPVDQGRMQVAACSDGRDGGSPAPVGKLVAHEATEAGGGGGSGGSGSVVVPAAGAWRAVKMDMRVLQCPLCTLPLKPPILQCNGGHLACGGCLTVTEPCRRCEHGGGFDIRNTAMDAVVSAARVECPHDGCRTYVAYHKLIDHRGACPRAPCSCPEPGCGFAAPPRALAVHLFVRHSMPAHKFQYGEDFRLLVPASELSRRLLIGGDDGRAFLLTVGALGAATAVWVVCVRASAILRPQYSCKMWSIMPPSQDLVVVKTKVTSSTSPGAVAAVSFLTVPPRYYRVGAGVCPKLVPLNVRIEKI